MTRRIKTTFTGIIPANQISESGIEYYVTAADGKNESVFPAENYLSLIQEKADKITLGVPVLKADKLQLSWQPIKGASYYKIYRCGQKDFNAGPEYNLTFIAGDATLSFSDNGKDFKGDLLKGDWYYRITAVDKRGYESAPSDIMTIKN
jgi:hypothetical protein